VSPVSPTHRAARRPSREEALEYLHEHEQLTGAEWDEWTLLTSSRGIKRQLTPDAKVVHRMTRLNPVQYVKPNTLQHVKQQKYSSPAKSARIISCQVCWLPSTQWQAGEPLLLNACDQPVKVPGNFCSKECYEHI